ncbi:hypothetical protein F5Y16DRAFT_407696 [Xylariaceae sp. FL0255]|nr:hypothetical protein F5Y16DRAFT_407696 [Xylariaceae sp. FL0255]
MQSHPTVMVAKDSVVRQTGNGVRTITPRVPVAWNAEASNLGWREAQRVRRLRATCTMLFPSFFGLTNKTLISITSGSTISRSPISRTSSIASVSPAFTDCTSELHPLAQQPRGPSPLRYVTRPLSSGSGIESRMSGIPADSKPAKKLEPTNLHFCLWGQNGDCGSGGFVTRQDLNRHVKAEHLLECPISGCTTETVFESREQLACHLGWDHPVTTEASTTVGRSSNLMEDQGAPTETASTPRVENAITSAGDKIQERQISIENSKDRCRNQLRVVLEKRLERRLKRLNGLPSTNANSPISSQSRDSRPLETPSFPLLWEHSILPFLIEFMPKWHGPGHVISVTRGKKPNSRRICVMTRRPMTMARKVVIATHVRDLLPDEYRDNVKFVFSVGKVDRLVWARGLGKGMPDEVCSPRNPFAYISPCMGDSIGAHLDSGEDITATLGPCIIAEGGTYWLANFHPFVGTDQRTSPVTVEHPSPQDRGQCISRQHDALESRDISFRIGRSRATSGFDLKTTRISHDPYWDDLDKEHPLVVTDWMLMSAETRQANLLRKFPSITTRRETPVVETASITPGANVMSTGRTSGFQRGQVCEVPAYVDGHENGTGKATREWFIEEPFPYDNENEWIRGGIGVEGDSGAAIVDSDTNALIGQLYGRNNYYGPGPRHTWFTPIDDIFDDIQEKCGMMARPKLPQHRDDAETFAVYPLCKPCFDLREYLDSRRSSRESLMSMIGVNDMRAEKDIDVPSVSELATPRDQSNLLSHVGLDSNLVSHAGMEDAVASVSFGNALSPAPIHAFYASIHMPSPGASNTRSPYAQELCDEDLFDSKRPGVEDGALGKRTTVIPIPRQGSTQQSAKRRRIS